ncbi:hypothetical protein BC941DRAFT_426800 [Chlamydoabsidia padenii]|nr:hypothetical protein BC941DRAFT_426800 [Chlamydoabsidia padenii]
MDLPPEILGSIFQHLSQQRLPQCALVCRQWLPVARKRLYHTIALYNFDQTKRLIASVNDNSGDPPLGQLIRNIVGVPSGLDVKDIKALEMHCSYLERIDLGNPSYVPLWYHLKQLSLTSISFRDRRIGHWLINRGHQLDRLTTNLDAFWGRYSPYASFTMIVMTCPAGHFANLTSLTLAKGDTSFYYPHHSDPELELDPHLLHTIHRACPVLTAIKFVYPRLPVSFKNMSTTSTLPPVTTVTTTSTITIIERFDTIRTLNLKISSRTCSVFFDLFAMMYPAIERLDLEIEEVNKDDDIRRRLRTPQLFNNYRARLLNMATSFKNLKEMRLHTSLTHDILEVYWAHHGWIDWVDSRSLLGGTTSDSSIGQKVSRKRFERFDITCRNALVRNDDENRIYVGNGTSLVQLSHLSISLDMFLPRLMNTSLLHGQQLWPYLTTLYLKTNKYKVIVMETLLSAAPLLVSLTLDAVTFKSLLGGNRKSVEQRRNTKKPRIQYQGDDGGTFDKEKGNNSNDDNTGVPLHGLEELHLSNCELPAMDMITQWMARCPKLKGLSGRKLDFYGRNNVDDHVTAPDLTIHRGDASKQQQDWKDDRPLSLVSISDWSPYSKEDYIQSSPLIHINAPHHQLEYVSLEDIHYHDISLVKVGDSMVKDQQHYGLFLSLVVEQLWRSPHSDGFFTDIHLDCYSNTPQKAYFAQTCTGSMIQSPKGYIKLTCQSLDGFAW